MRRYAKTYSQPQRPGEVAPYSNKFAIDLMGIDIDDDQLARIRSEAVRAAMTAAAKLLKRDNIFDAFGTFSTFSTFSTFGSGGGFDDRPSGEISAPAQRAIDDVAGPRGATRRGK